MSHKLSKTLQREVRFLAVNYQAYIVQVNYAEHGAERDNGIIVWGGMLIASQEKLGVEIIEPELIRTLMDQARRRENERKGLAA